MSNVGRPTWFRWLFPVACLIAALALLQFVAPDAAVVRGKGSALPISDLQSDDQMEAQAIAVVDEAVRAYTDGTRAEVFAVMPVVTDYTERAAACATDNCWQVNIYDLDADATIAALVSLDQDAVLDVLYMPHMQPYLPKRLSDRAVEIALAAPEVAQVLGDRPLAADWTPMPANLVNSVCESGRLCVAALFDLEDYLLWAFVDLKTETLVDISWTAIDPDPGIDRGADFKLAQRGCDPPVTITQDGWTLTYAVAGSDGLAITNASYNGMEVLTRAKLVQWNVDYGTSGFRDSTGCDGNGGFLIWPYGDTAIVTLDGGFEIRQDFRMGGWGGGCAYRYEQRYQFYADGRFRVKQGAFGKGCNNNGIYRPLVRIDMAVDGDEGDTVSQWANDEWSPLLTEAVMPDVPGPFTLNETSPEGYAWRIDDANGAGYYIEPGRGQFGDEGRGDNEYFYVVQHKPSEGDADMGAIGSCCSEPFHGPEEFVNGESVDSTNVVLWYVPQSQTVPTAPDYYCWTVSGEPNPETYPCWTGPMFHPIAEEPQSFGLYIPLVAKP